MADDEDRRGGDESVVVTEREGASVEGVGGARSGRVVHLGPRRLLPFGTTAAPHSPPSEIDLTAWPTVEWPARRKSSSKRGQRRMGRRSR